MRAGFWRRLAAAWVDLFVIYALSSFFISICAIAHLRLSLELVFPVGGVCYAVALLASYGQTAGKMLLGISVTARTGGPTGLSRILVHEALGKWVLSVAAPVVVGRAVIGQAWVPSIYDLALLLLVLLLLLLYYLIAKRTW
jgi:uncharacterized RDD family membrane protein YckC